jgi:hypothetical protein
VELGVGVGVGDGLLFALTASGVKLPTKKAAIKATITNRVLIDLLSLVCFRIPNFLSCIYYLHRFSLNAIIGKEKQVSTDSSLTVTAWFQRN